MKKLFIAAVLALASVSAHAENFVCDVAFNGNHNVSNINFQPLNRGNILLVQRAGYKPFMMKKITSNPDTYHSIEDVGQTAFYIDGVWTITQDALPDYTETCYKN